MTKGIDVSKFQGVIDWKKVKTSGVEFAMLRAGYGWDNDSQIDERFAANAQGARAAGVPFGAYHYSYALSAADAAKEARFFLRILSGLKPEYPVAFDFEEPSALRLPKEQQLAIIEAFLGEVEGAGYYGMLYASASTLTALRQYAPQRIAKYDCWVAHVGVSKPAYSGPYGMWQYTWKGVVDGIKGDVDMDYAYKDYPAIIKAAGLNGYQSPGEPETDYKALYEAEKVRAEAAEAMLTEIRKLVN